MPAASKQINCLAIIKKEDSSLLSDLLALNSRGFNLSITYVDTAEIQELKSESGKYNLYLYLADDKDFSISSASKIRSLAVCPLIFILKNEDYKLSYDLMRAGADDCIMLKDSSPEVLAEILNRLCRFTDIAEADSQITGFTAVETISHLLKNTKMGFAVFNKDGKMLECNNSIQKMFGFGKKQLLSMKLADICRTSGTADVAFDKINSTTEKYLEIEKPCFNNLGDLVYCRIYLTIVKENKSLPELILMLVSDITSRKIIQQELEKEKYFLQTLLDNIPDAIYFKDTEHRFLKVSKYVHLHGIHDPQEAVGKTDFDFFTDEHAHEAYQDEENIIKTGKPLINKVEKETFPNGEVAWVSTTKAPLFDHYGNVSGIVGISRDVTDIKIKEEALLKSEERFRNLIEYSPDTIAIIFNGRLVFTNAAGLSLMKASDRSELISKDIQQLIAPEYKTRVRYFTHQVLKNKMPVKSLKLMLRRLDGELIESEVTAIPISYYNKPAIQIILRDITEVKKQEKIQETTLNLLKASNYANTTDELFRYIHQAVGDLMPVKNFYIAIYDEKTELLSFPYFIDEEDERMAPKKLGKGLTEYVLRTGKAQLITEQMDIDLRDSGEVELIGAPAKIWLGVPLQVKEKTIGVIVVQDYNNESAYSNNDKQTLELISFSVSRAIERKMAEEEILNYVQQLKETNATKDRFFSYISHDLRSPFSSLLGFSELVLADYDNLTSEEVKRYLEIIGATSRNLYNLLNNLLQFTRFQTGRVHFNPLEISLKDLIQRNVELIKGNIIKKEINLINEIKEDIHVYVDEEMISSVVQNLLTNALKFTARKGEIKLSCHLHKKINEVEIWVSDTGVGMDQETIGKLFRIEVIQTTSGTEREGGTGLGLILTKESVEKNNGRIWVESAPGKGTTFKFTLPLPL